MRSSEGLSISAGRAFLALASLPALASAIVIKRDNSTTPLYTPSAPSILEETSTTLYTPSVQTTISYDAESTIITTQTSSENWLPNGGSSATSANTPNAVNTPSSDNWLPGSSSTDSTTAVTDITNTPSSVWIPSTSDITTTPTSSENWIPNAPGTDTTVTTPDSVNTPVVGGTETTASTESTSSTETIYSTPGTYTTTGTDGTTTSEVSTEETASSTSLFSDTSITSSTTASDQTTTASDAGITIPPATSTVTGAEATSSVSSVSSEIVALFPFINSWKADPTGLKTDTLNKVDDVKNEVETVISELGGSTSSGCDSKRRRGLFGLISDVINTLTCVVENLNKITDDINLDDVDAVEGVVSTITSETDDLTDEDDDNSSKTQSDSESTTSAESTTSTCTEATALHVTILCEPTTFTSDDAVVSTTTCFSSTTVTTAGCSATDYTSIISTATSTETQVPCASDTCGDSCPMNGAALSADMSVTSTEDCAALPTSTTSSLPTASYGVLYSAAVASPTEESTSDSVSRRKVSIEDRSLAERALDDVSPPYANYVSQLRPAWVSQVGLASGTWYDFPSYGHASAGVNGIYGCTAVMIISEKGIYLSHIWENPVFIDNDWNPTSDDDFNKNSFEALRDGTDYAQSITALVGSDDNPGVLNTIYSPRVFVLSPYTSEWDKTVHQITTKLRYQDRASSLATKIAGIIPGSGTPFVLGYTRTSAQDSTAEAGTAGRAILEVDPFQSWLVSSAADAPADSAGLQVGRWRLWVEDQLITYQDFWIPWTLSLKRKRDADASAACSLSLASKSSTATTTDVSSETAAATTTSDFTSSSIIANNATDTGVTTPTTTSETTAITTKETTTIASTTGSVANETISTPTDSLTTETSSTAQYCTSYDDASSSTGYCTCSSTAGSSTLYTSAPLTDGQCGYSRYPTPTLSTLMTTTVESSTTELTTVAAETTTEATFTGDPLCVNYGGPRVTSAYCQCSTTVSAQTFFTTAPLISGKCTGYATFPAEVTLAPTTTAAEITEAPTPLITTEANGEILSYASQTVIIGEVYTGIKVTYTQGLGTPITIQPATPSETSANNEGSSQCGSIDDACDRAVDNFDDGTIYHEYKTTYARIKSGIIMVATFGQAGCTAQYTCDDYTDGMTGKQIKDAIQYMKDNDGVTKCGTTYLSNTCHITLNYCTNCHSNL